MNVSDTGEFFLTDDHRYINTRYIRSVRDAERSPGESHRQIATDDKGVEHTLRDHFPPSQQAQIMQGTGIVAAVLGDGTAIDLDIIGWELNLDGGSLPITILGRLIAATTAAGSITPKKSMPTPSVALTAPMEWRPAPISTPLVASTPGRIATLSSGISGRSLGIVTGTERKN
jgi:hypothetical protein